MQPLAPEEPAPPTIRSRGKLSAADAAWIPLPGALRVLLVEDHAINREVAQRMLDQIGVEVEIAVDGRQALSALARGRFDVVLMDCQMPDMDGLEATRAIRTREAELALPRLPIIALTANALTGDRERCLQAGMDDFVSKPFRQDDLAGALDRVLRRSAPSLGLAAQPPAARALPLPLFRMPPGCPAEDRPSACPALEPAAASPPSLDREALSRIRALQQPGRPDLLAKLFDVYVTASPREIDALEEALRTGDAPTATRLAHTLKSTSAALGASSLAGTLARIEVGARAAEVAPLLAEIPEVRRRYDVAVRALGAEIESTP